MEKHVTDGQQKSPKAKRKRTRGWELCLVLWSCDLTQKMHGWISSDLAALKIWAHLLVFLHSKLGPNKVASNKKGMGEELQNVWRSGKSWFFLQENFIWLILVIFNLSYLVRGKTSWLHSLPFSIIYIPWQAYTRIPIDCHWLNSGHQRYENTSLHYKVITTDLSILGKEHTEALSKKHHIPVRCTWDGRDSDG